MQKQDGLSNMERSSEKNSDLRSRVNCESVQTGVKGQDERQKNGALDTALHTNEIPCALLPKNAQKRVLTTPTLSYMGIARFEANYRQQWPPNPREILTG
jgi:hypothetical protein